MKKLLAAILTLAVAAPASATVLEYELEGRILSPIVDKYGLNGRVFNTVNTNYSFEIVINRGDLILTHDDRGTASFADDIVNIAGTTFGAIGRTNNPSNWVNGKGFSKHQKFGNGNFWGSGQFAWDFTLQNPLLTNPKGPATTGDDNLVYGMQNAGALTLLNAPNGVTAVTPLMVKNNENLGYGFRLFDVAPLGDLVFRIDTWILAAGGLLGGETRFESLPTESVFNSSLNAYLKNGTPPNPIPEPATAGLLISGLLGGGLLKKRKAQAN